MFGQRIPWLYVRVLRYNDDSLVVFRRHVTDTMGDVWQAAAVTISTKGPYRVGMHTKFHL